jgi:hypothetical protein
VEPEPEAPTPPDPREPVVYECRDSPYYAGSLDLVVTPDSLGPGHNPPRVTLEWTPYEGGACSLVIEHFDGTVASELALLRDALSDVLRRWDEWL